MTDKEIRQLKAEFIMDLQDARELRAVLRVALMQMGEPLLKLGRRLMTHSLDYDLLSEKELAALDVDKLTRLLTEHKEAAEREERLQKAAERLNLK